MLYYYISYYSAVTDTKTSSIIELLLSLLYPIFFWIDSQVSAKKSNNSISANSFAFLISNAGNND